MKFVKFTTFLALSIMSMQCLASKVVCAQGYDLEQVTRSINRDILTEKNVSAPKLTIINDLKTICVTAN